MDAMLQASKNDDGSITNAADAPDSAALAAELKVLMDDHKVEDASVLDLRPHNLWTDFFVVGTINSTAHMDGVRRQIEDWAAGKGLERKGRGKTADYTKGIAQPGWEAEILWSVLDMGNIVAHLMSKETRTFYDLDRLWAAP
jgi:ribosome-associated protein